MLVVMRSDATPRDVDAVTQFVRDLGYEPVVIDGAQRRVVAISGNKTRVDTAKLTLTEESLAYAVRSGGLRMVYTGDTGPSDELAAWANGCDLLLCECSLPEDRAIDIHLTPIQAGRLAATAGASSLVLTHFYPPVESPDPATIAGRAFHGEVVAASDGDQFVIGRES